MPKSPVNVYIDGYNLYRGIKDSPRLYPYYLWLDIAQLCTNLVNKRDEVVRSIKFFTAYPIGGSQDNQEKLFRHKTYMGAIQAKDTRVEVRLGIMQPRPYVCEVPKIDGGCQLTFRRFIEKQTDVGIGATMVADVLSNECSSVYIISGDSDLVPACRIVRERRPDVKIRFWFPPKRGTFTDELKDNSDSWNVIDDQEIMLRQLPFIVRLPSGATFQKPKKWEDARLAVAAA
jgi:uncharacterized LabA/DUF88 family protein